MTWTTPTTEIIRTLRLRDGPNYVVPQEFIQNLMVDEVGNICFPIYGIDGVQVGWNSRAAAQKLWSQNITYDVAPRFTAWTPQIAQIIYTNRRICIAEGPFDALALAPVLPWTIAANTARVQREIIEWCKMWKLDVVLALDFDAIDPKTQRKTGQNATIKLRQELTMAGCRSHQLIFSPTGVSLDAQGQVIHLKDPSQAFAIRGVSFHREIELQIQSAFP